MRRTLLPHLYLALLASWVLLAVAQQQQQRQQEQQQRPAPSTTELASLTTTPAQDVDVAVHTRSLSAHLYGHDGVPGSASGASSSASQPPRPRSPADLILTGVMIVTTVEGGLFGLDRTTGETIWEVPPHTSSSAKPSQDEPFSGFGPLVRSTYGPERSSFVELLQGGANSGGLASAPTRPKYEPRDERGNSIDAVALLEQVGIYIVEPSSAGDIYMLTPASHQPGSSPGSHGANSSPEDGHGEHGAGSDPLSVPRTHLSKLPLTLPQLVQLSPFSFAGDDSRIFIGKKSTTLVELDIATGSIGAVWGGSSPDSAATNSSAESFEDHSSHNHDHAQRPWTYIGRTDYTLTIHSRNRPALSQTLYFSTYAPTAADMDIQAIWSQAGHPDHRAVIGTGEEQTVVCFNTTSSPSSTGAAVGSAREEERTVWRTSVGGTVAGIFDVVQPSPAASVTTTRADYRGTGTTASTASAAPSDHAAETRHVVAGTRPVIVPHPPVSLSSLFGSRREVSVGLGMRPPSDYDDDLAEDGSSPLFDSESMGMSDSQQPAYLGFSGGSLFAMGANRYPLAAFSPRAAAGLDGSTADSTHGLGPGGKTSPLDETDSSTDVSVRPCSAFGCWLGSYPVEVDAEMDRKVQDALLGSARRPLGIADHHEDYWGAPTSSIPGIEAPPPRTSASTETRRPGEAGPTSPASSNSSQPVAAKSWTRRLVPDLTTFLFQVVGLGCITLFSYTLIMGVNEQQRLSEERASTIAEQVVYCPQDTFYVTDEQAHFQTVVDPETGQPRLVQIVPPSLSQMQDFSPPVREKPLPDPPAQIVELAQASPSPEEVERLKRLAAQEEAAAAERARKQEEFRRLAQATDVKTLAAFIEQKQNGGGPSHGQGSSQAHASANGEGAKASSQGQNGAGTGTGKSNGGKRRRRGKRAGAAVAAKAAARAAAAGEQDAADGEDDDGDEEDGDITAGSGGGNGTSATPGVLVNGRPTTPNANGISPSKKDRKQLGASAVSAAKANGVRFAPIAQDDGMLTPNATNDRLAPANAAATAAAAGARLFFNGPHSPTTTALLDGGWIQAGPDSASAEEQLARMAALASRPGSVRAPDAVGDGVVDGASPTSASGRQLISKTSGLTISDEVLGYGSSGTVVFKGTFQGRAVAVKRLLRDFVNVASKEVSLLESADNHPNVIRYFYKELTGSFLYIALELCPASLADVIDKPTEYRELHNILEPKRALQQIASGVRHLHSLHIVHRDIKPQNILVAVTPNGKKLKMLLSDFGLSKRLDGLAQTSFSQTVNNPGGTVGWRAPEILRGDVQLDNGGSESEQSSVGLNPDGTRDREPTEERKRLTRAVDIFALGCVAYYILANGEHPFGSKFEREMNIIRNCKNLSRLDGLGEEGVEAQHLINTMIQVEPRERPSASDVLSHPYFWDAGKRLNFLQEASDRFEIMERDPPAPALVALEAKAPIVLGGEWYKKVDRAFVDDLGKFRKYDPRSVQDLLRALRNKKHHYQDLSPHLKKLLGPLPSGFLTYFTRRFPLLFMHVHTTLSSQPLIPLEAQFREYFEPAEHEH